MKKIHYLLLILLTIISLSIKAEEFQDIGYIEIEEVSEEPGIVSTLGKQFRLIIHHDPAYTPAETIDTFDRTISPLLTNLQIIKRNLDRNKKNPKNIRRDFIFNLEEDSSASEKYSGFVLTKYLSNTQIFKNASRLNFKIELFDYLDDLQTIDTRNLRTLFNEKYDIEALEFEFNSMEFNGANLVFSSKNPEKKISKIISETYSVISSVETSINLSDSVKNLKFKTESPTNKKIASKIKKDGTKAGNKSHRLIPKVDQDLITIINTNGNFYQVEIPVSFESKKKLTKAELTELENLDLLIMPIFLDIKTGDGRDLKLSGILRDTVEVNFDNGSTTSEIK